MSTIYLLPMNGGDLIGCGTPEEALDVISRNRMFPNGVRVWRADAPMVDIGFEGLQLMVGHDPVDIDGIGRGVDGIVAGLDVLLRVRGLTIVEDRDSRSVSTCGIPSGHQAVKREYGNPCAMVVVDLMAVGQADDPRVVGHTELHELVDLASQSPGLGGWAMIHSDCTAVLHVPGLPPLRRIGMFLSRPRAMFDRR